MRADLGSRMAAGLARRLFGPHRHLWLLAVLIALVELAVAGAVYLTGGTAYVTVHLMYLPIVFCGLVFGVWGGVAAGLLGGLLLGPFMPLEVLTHVAQPGYGWPIRLVFFAFFGAFAGSMSDLLRLRAVHNANYARLLREGYARMLRTLAGALARRDHATAQHSERVAYNARALAQRLGLRGRQLEFLYWAALLHDLGKIEVPESVLGKPGPLIPDERRVIERHPDVGAELLLSASPEFAPIAALVRAHHEKWDGSGYPFGIREEQIPLGSRLIAVMDVFEALTSTRPYRQPLSVEDALRHIEAGAGTAFDPRVVAAFLELASTGRLALEAGSPPVGPEVLVPLGREG